MSFIAVFVMKWTLFLSLDDVRFKERDRVALQIREHGRQEQRKRRKEQIHWRPDRTVRRRIVKKEKIKTETKHFFVYLFQS